jgi:hypothetical protein
VSSPDGPDRSQNRTELSVLVSTNSIRVSVLHVPKLNVVQVGWYLEVNGRKLVNYYEYAKAKKSGA